MKTLYITDLDGTLLDKTPKTSEYTNSTINNLLDNGIVFSFATARSLTTTKLVTTGLNWRYPAVVHNGSFIVDLKTDKILYKNIFDKADAKNLLNDFLGHKLCPIVFSLIDSKQKFSYIRETANSATIDFLDKRVADPRNRRCYNNLQLFDGEIYYFTLIGNEEKIRPLYEKYKDKFRCLFQIDMYCGEYWLEIMPKESTKANAVLKLKEILNCDKVVCFGDGINDIDMFSIADECYATENAVDKLKQKSTKIIEANCDDGVAKWLFMRYNDDV